MIHAFVIELPGLRTKNPLNGQSGNSRLAGIIRARERSKQRQIAAMATKPRLGGYWVIEPPKDCRCTVTLIRLSSGTMDTDGLAASLKGVRDGVADALQVDDGDPRVTWRYAQAKAALGAHGVRIEIETRGQS